MTHRKATGSLSSLLRSLRIKFIGVIMATVAVVLAFAFSLTVYLAWQSDTANERETLEEAMQTTQIGRGRQGMPPLGWRSEMERHPHGEAAQLSSLEMPVALYTIENDTLTPASSSSGLLSDDALAEVTGKMIDAPMGFGRFEALGLSYLKEMSGDRISVAFVESGSFEGWRSLAFTLSLVGGATLVAFFLIGIFLSRWALKPVEAAWDRQRRFVADASHELKTPLSIASANISILLDEPEMPAEERERWLESSSVALRGMRELCDKMLALATLDEGNGTADNTTSDSPGAPTTEVTDLSRTLLATTLSFEVLSFERGFTLTEEIEKGIRLRSDREDLERLVGILMDNACKYVSEGGTVNVDLSHINEGALLKISNTGNTIPQDQLDHIFERFYRADASHAQGEGHGLGLSIAQGIVNRMGATMSATSENGLTTFSVLFSDQSA